MKRLATRLSILQSITGKHGRASMGRPGDNGTRNSQVTGGDEVDDQRAHASDEEGGGHSR